MKKRVFAILLTAALCIGLMPTSALAEAEDATGEETTIEEIGDSVVIEENDDGVTISENEKEKVETETYSDVGESTNRGVQEKGNTQEEVPEEIPEEEDEENSDIMTLSEGMGDVLDGDYAYLTNVGMAAGDNGGYSMTTGTAPWDEDDEAGNDSSEYNRILRTFDTATYSVDMTTNVREDAPYGTYKTGNLYFELVVWGTEDEVQWETGSMGWLESKHGVYNETSEVYGDNTYQVLRGYITLEPSTDDGHAIGNTTQELSLVLRALALQNGYTVTPEFTFFMAYNDVGLSEEQYNAWGTSNYNGPIVTFEGASCATHNEKEYQTVIAPEITISAAPRYNLALVNSTESKTQQMGSYDFSTGNTLALNQDAGIKYGRLGSYGLVLQLVGKDASSGLRGVQIPQEGETLDITFNLDLSSTYTSGTTVYETGTTSQGVDLTKYAPLVWSFDVNKSGSSQQDNRSIPTSVKYADQVPYNAKDQTSDAYWYDSCNDGGSWSITPNTDGTYTVSITGCKVDMQQLPYVHPGAGTSLSYRYYNPNNINYDPSDDSKNDYWDVETACLSAGELWVVQPYYSGEKDDGETYIAGMLGEGTYSVTASDTVLSVSQGDSSVFERGTTQAVTTDDSVSQSMALVNPGTIDQHIAYVKYNYAAYNDPLTDGCFSSAKDWILQGNQLGIETYVTNDSAEEGNTGVAYDVMMKFDDAFFEPDGTIKFSGNLNGETRTNLWAAKPDGSGWDHAGLDPDQDGYDSEMINATPDDLIYYDSLDALKADGATCVGVLVQYRGLMTEQQNHLHTYVLGTNKTTCETDQVYMVTPYCRAWDRDDLAEAMVAGGEYDSTSEALSALMGMSVSEVNAEVNKYIPTRTASSSLKYEDDSGNSTGDYPDCHWKNGDRRHPTTATGGSSRTPTILNYVKCYYDENGCHEGTSGNYWGDSCLVVGYKSGLTMQVVQPTTAGDGSTHNKSVFDMDTGQTVVDYEISPFIERNNGEQSTESMTYTDVEITVAIPENLSYINGSSYIGGEYTTNGEGKEGTVTGGVHLTEGEETSVTFTVDGTDYTVGVLLTVTEENGTQTLTYTFTNVPVTGTELIQYLQNIYYSCEISSGAVKNGTELDVTADISCTSDAGIDPSSRSDGEATVGITVTKATAISLVKTADATAVDVNEEIGFTMDIGDNSDNDMEMVAVDNIPYNGDGVSTFVSGGCEVYVTEFSAYDVTTTRDLSGFYFFYTTDKAFAGKTSADYPDGEYFVLNYGIEGEETVNPQCLADGWVEIETEMVESTDGAGHDVYTFTNFPTNQQVYAIVGIGTITGQDDINMHVTLKLSDPEPGDVIVNSFSQQHSTTTEGEDGQTVTTYYDLSDNARARVVGRTVGGTVWLDEDMDGGIRTGTYKEEQLLAGVDVELQILQNDSWSTAKNLKTDKELKTTTNESGYYEFNYVPQGTFRVVVSGSGTAGTGSVVKPTALTSYSLNDHEVTTYEAAGIDASVNSKVERDDTDGDTISGIAMPAPAAISGNTYDVEYQNAGYTKGQQLDVSKIWKLADGTEVTEGNGTTEITATVATSQNTWSVKLNEDNEWTDTIDDLWYYDGSGNPVEFVLNSNITVTENGQPKKYQLKDTQLTGNAEDGFAVAIENDEVTTEISGEKTWEDNDNQDGVRPNNITIVLLANGEQYATQTVQADNEGKWTWSFTDLPKYDDNDEEIHYSIAEISIDDYTPVIDGTDVINTHTPEKTGINVEKLWRDNDDQDGERPDSITVKLLKNGEETGEELILNEDNNWQGSFTDLDKYEPEGKEIEYSVAEIKVDGYTTTILPIDDTSTIIISNVHPSATVDISGEKTWDDNDDQDGIRPESITVHLLRDGEEIDSVTVPDDEGNWAWSWESLPEYHDHGQEYEYTVEEEPVDGYTTDVVNDYDIVNTHVPETIDMSGFKTWDDADDQDGKRPESITINLLADGDIIQTIEVTAENDWKWSFTDLPKYKDGGMEIQYQITEDSLEDYDYSTTYGENGEIINSYTPEQTSLTVIKVWDDGNNADKIRAASITVELLKNGDPTGQTIVLTPDDNWTGSFTELDKYTDGKENVYTVQEEDVEGYYSEITGDETSGYVITNTHTPEKTPGGTGGNGGNGGGSKTGDTNNIGLWITLLIAAFVVAIVAALRLRKRS